MAHFAAQLEARGAPGCGLAVLGLTAARRQIWALAEDGGKRAETFVACHLLKAVEMWTDLWYNFGQ